MKGENRYRNAEQEIQGTGERNAMIPNGAAIAKSARGEKEVTPTHTTSTRGDPRRNHSLKVASVPLIPKARAIAVQPRWWSNHTFDPLKARRPGHQRVTHECVDGESPNCAAMTARMFRNNAISAGSRSLSLSINRSRASVSVRAKKLAAKPGIPASTKAACRAPRVPGVSGLHASERRNQQKSTA